MKYESITLDLELEEARKLVGNRVSGLSVREQKGRIEYASQSGYRLAVLKETTLPNGDAGTTLQYRTTMLSPTAAFARQKAREIRHAVDSHRY